MYQSAKFSQKMSGRAAKPSIVVTTNTVAAFSLHMDDGAAEPGGVVEPVGAAAGSSPPPEPGAVAAAAGPEEGDATGVPRSAGQLLTSALTLHREGSSSPRVAFKPAVEGSPLVTSCNSWHKHTGWDSCTARSAAQQSDVGGVLSLPLTNAKHVCSDANALEQSTLLPVGPDAATGAGVAAVGVAATGAGVAAVGVAATGTGVAAAGAGTETEGAAATGDGTVAAGAATGAVVGGGATGAVAGGVAMVGAMVGGAGGLVPDFGARAGATAAAKEPHWMAHKSNATNTGAAGGAPCIILIAIFDPKLTSKVQGLDRSAVFKILHLELDLRPGPPDSKTRSSFTLRAHHLGEKLRVGTCIAQ